MSSSNSSHRRHKKKHRHCCHNRRSPSRESLHLVSLFKSLFHEELGRISSKVAVMEGQSSSFIQTGSGPEQSLHTTPPVVHSEEQSLPTAAAQAKQQSLLYNIDRADRAEPQIKGTPTLERPDATTWDRGEDGGKVIDYDKSTGSQTTQTRLIVTRRSLLLQPRLSRTPSPAPWSPTKGRASRESNPFLILPSPRFPSWTPPSSPG